MTAWQKKPKLCFEYATELFKELYAREKKRLTRKWDPIKIKVLEDEIKYFKSCIEEHDTGHIHTTIDALETRLKLLKGIETDDPIYT